MGCHSHCHPTVEYTAEIELYDKLHALGQLMKHFKDLPQAGAGQGLSNVEVLNTIARYLAEVEDDSDESPPDANVTEG